MRLIDADELAKKFTNANASGINLALDRYAVKCIEDAPTIEQPERKHGKWIMEDNPGTGWYRVTCSECGENVTSEIPMIGFIPNAKALWDYCPYCGADMREDEQE